VKIKVHQQIIVVEELLVILLILHLKVLKRLPMQELELSLKLKNPQVVVNKRLKNLLMMEMLLF